MIWFWITLFVAVVVHEFGHYFIARIENLNPYVVTSWLGIGIQINMNKTPLQVWYISFWGIALGLFPVLLYTIMFRDFGLFWLYIFMCFPDIVHTIDLVSTPHKLWNMTYYDILKEEVMKNGRL